MANTDDVKKLRDHTGVSVMQCKQALDEAGGDYDKALIILQKKAGAIAEKKADRELGAGAIAAYVHSNKEVGAMVVLHSETDFVAKNEEFVALAYDIAMHIAATNPKYVKREDVDEKELAAIKETLSQEVAKEAGDKPADIQEKILSGKIDSYLKMQILLEQEFIKDQEKTIQDLLTAATQKFGERIEVGEVKRFSTR